MGVINYNGALYLATGIDNSGLRRDASEAESIIEHLGRTAQSVGAMMGVAFTLDAAKDFAVKVATVRGEFQKLEAAFKTMLGNKEAADRLMQQLTRTAATTPFGMEEVAGGAKQLLAYGVAANEVNDTLVRLGNIASGLSIPLNDLVYLYGTTMTQGRLFTQDLRQFMGRGIPIADELAKQFGVTKDQVQGLVEAGKVGFPEVQKALESLTNEGGKFYNLMEEQSKTIAGKISNLSDAIEMMFNDIGKSSEGVIANALDGVTSLVESYKQIGSVLAQLVIAYGTYKAALIAITTAKSVYTKTSTAITEQMALEQRLALSMGKEITESEARQAAQTKLLSAAKAGLVSKLKNVATALAPNLYAAAIVAVGALAKALYDMASEASGAERAVETLNRVTREAEDEAEKERAKIDLLIAIIKDENTVRSAKEKALRDLHAIAPDILGDITMEMIATGKYIPVVERLTAALRAKNQAERESDEIAQSRARVKAIQNDAKNGTSDRSFFHRFLAGVTTVGQSVSGMPVNGRTYEDQYDKLTKERNKKRLRNELDFQRTMTQNAVKSANEHAKAMADAKDAAGNESQTLAGLRKEIQNGDALLKRMRAEAASGKRSLEDVEELEKRQNERKDQYRTMTGQSYDRGSKAGASAYKKNLNELEKEKREKAEAMAEIEELTRNARKRIEDADLEMMNEGLEKKLQKIDLDYQRELQEIEEWKKKLEKANKTLTGKEALTEDQQAYYEASKAAMDQKNMKARANATNEWKRKEAEAYDEMLQAFGNYKEKEAAIAREYARKIADAEKEGRTNEANKLRAEQAREAATLADKELGNNEALVFFFKYAEKQSLKTAKAAQSYIANVLEYLRTKGKSVLSDMSQKPFLDQLLGDEEKTKEAIERFTNDLDKAKEVVQSIGNQKVFDALINNFKKLKKAAAGSQEQMAALNGVTGGLSTIGGMVTQLGNAMADCDIKAGKVVVTVGNTITSIASFAAAGTSVAGVWGAIVGAVVGAASAIIPAIGKIDEWSQSLEKSYDSQLQWLDKARDANIELIKGYGSVAEKIDLATKAIENNVKALELLYQKSRELREYQSEDKNGHSVWYMDRQKVATAMRDMGAFENYDEWEKTHVTDAKKRYEYNKYVRNPKNVHSTQGVPLLLEAMQNGYVPIKIKAEFDKQGLDLQKFLDDPSKYLLNDKEGALNYEQMKWLQDTYPALLGALDSRQRELVEQRMEHLKKESEGVKKALEESLAGVSYDTLLSEYESALKTMGDGAAALGKNIENHLRDAIIKGLIDGKTKERIKKAYDRIIEIMKKRDTMSAEEYQKELQDARTELEGIYKELREQKRLAFEKAGIKEDDEVKDNTLRGALAKASQESIDLLAGVMGAIRVSIEQIIRLMNESRGKGGGVAEYYDSVRQSFAALREIQIAGWKEVTAIKEMVQQIHVTQVTVAQLSQTVADHTASIKETSRRMAESITAINNSGVKIKGGGLGL